MKRTMKKSDNILKGVESDIIEVERLQGQIEVLQQKVVEHKNAIKEAMQEAGQSSHTLTGEDGLYKITYVESSSVVIDEDKLRKKIGAPLWNKVTTRKLDRKKLDAYIKSGEISVNAVATSSDEVARTPYVKIAKKSL